MSEIICYSVGMTVPDAVTSCTLLPWFWGHGTELTDGDSKVIFGEGERFEAMLDTAKFIQTLINEQFVTGFALAYLFHKKRFLSGLGRTSVIMLLISLVLTLIYMFVFRGDNDV